VVAAKQLFEVDAAGIMLEGAEGLPVDLAVAVIVEAELDPGGPHIGAQADLADARGALIAGAEVRRELSGRNGSG
jgi:hypothetical protein